MLQQAIRRAAHLLGILGFVRTPRPSAARLELERGPVPKTAVPSSRRNTQRRYSHGSVTKLVIDEDGTPDERLVLLPTRQHQRAQRRRARARRLMARASRRRNRR